MARAAEEQRPILARAMNMVGLSFSRSLVRVCGSRVEEHENLTKLENLQR